MNKILKDSHVKFLNGKIKDNEKEIVEYENKVRLCLESCKDTLRRHFNMTVLKEEIFELEEELDSSKLEKLNQNQTAVDLQYENQVLKCQEKDDRKKIRQLISIINNFKSDWTANGLDDFICELSKKNSYISQDSKSKRIEALEETLKKQTKMNLDLRNFYDISRSNNRHQFKNHVASLLQIIKEQEDKIYSLKETLCENTFRFFEMKKKNAEKDMDFEEKLMAELSREHEYKIQQIEKKLLNQFHEDKKEIHEKTHEKLEYLESKCNEYHKDNVYLSGICHSLQEKCRRLELSNSMLRNQLKTNKGRIRR